MRRGSPQVKLPDHPDALACEQPPRDRFNHCRLFHFSGPPSDALSLDQMVPRVGFEPTTYRLRSGCSTAELPGQRPAGDRGAYRDELLASNPSVAKPIRDLLSRSPSARPATAVLLRSAVLSKSGRCLLRLLRRVSAEPAC